MPFWNNVDLLPAQVREKAKEEPKKSAKAYAKGREKFKEGLRESEDRVKNKKEAADVMLYIELNEEELKEKMSDEKPEDIVKKIGSYDAKQWGQMQQAFGESRFDLSVDTDDQGKPIISMQVELPEGNVSEKMQLTQGLQDALVARALGKK
jgi:hypothetical protein